MKTLLSCLGLLALASCATGNPRATAVTALSDRDAPTISGGIERFIAVTLPANGTPIVLQGSETLVAPLLRSALTVEGYRLVDRGAPGAHLIGYRVDPMNGDVLLRVFVDNTTGSRLYRHDDLGFLHAAGPYTALVEIADGQP